jgi:hypothetical protein
MWYFDEVLSHGPPRSFPLLSASFLQTILVDLSPPHSDDDSPPESVSSSTLSPMTSQMNIDGEILTDSLEVSSSIMTTPPNACNEHNISNK